MYPVADTDIFAVWDAWVAEGNFALVSPGEGGLLGVITLYSMIVLHRPRPVGRITSLVVDPSARGRGIGRALVHAGEQALARADCGIIEVTSHVRRAEAHAFYRHLGYERTSHRFARDLARPDSPGVPGDANDATNRASRGGVAGRHGAENETAAARRDPPTDQTSRK